MSVVFIQLEDIPIPPNCLLPPALCLLPSASCPLPPALCLLPSALCPLPSASCLLPSALCLLPPALCPLPPALCPLPPALCLLPSSFCVLLEYCHLGWRTEFCIFFSYRLKFHAITKALCNTLCPSLKLCSCPFKTVIFVA